ncbi:Leucine-rich repeat-containing G-protein coupled receptor 4 [Trichoplax sp. H2]|nr:Leucine-rich repeat-containing G-protein coupled receptor 4 [Trichoplax sp. H2]|eukprot:RDD36391.1 Leucine-rich repeat-containing G-protein coupled receptor 4 [Trichoplax sp. H2]
MSLIPSPKEMLNATELKITSSTINVIYRNNFIKFPNLKSLSLCYNGITAIATRALCSLGQLKMLLLDGNSLTDIGIAGHDCLDHLETLNLKFNPIIHIAYDSLACLENLKYLNLSYNEIKEDDKIDLDEKTMLLNLLLAYNASDLSGNRYRYLDASKPLAQLTNANRLQTLNISSNRLKSVETFTFAKMESLRNLLVSSNQLQHLHFLEPLKTIKFLSVSENNIKNIDYADFSNLAELEHLNLAENQLIKAKIFNQIAGFVPFLQELYLQGNQIISTLDMSFKTFSNLMILNLRNNNISNIGNLTDQKLLTLDLAGNQIKKLSCHGFPNSTQNLNLADNRISAIHSNCYQILKKLNYLLYFRDLSQNRLREDSKLIWTTLENSKELRILNIAEIAIYNLSTIGPFKNLHAIDVSFNPVVFSTLLKFISIHIPKLKKINASNCHISEIPVGGWSIFRLLSTVILNNNNLTTIRSDNQTKMSVTTLNNLLSQRDFLCCKVPATVTLCRPHLNPNRLSSCLDLIAHSSTRLFLWLVTSVSLLGNVLIWIRHYGIRNRRSNFLHMFLVDNLNLSNLCMILYYLIIGVTDLNQHSQLYGRYAENWMASGPCLAAFTVIHLSLAASATFTLIVSIHYFLLSSSSTTFQLAKSTALRTAGIIWLILLIFSAIPVIISSRKSVYQYNNDIAGFCMTINEHDLLQNYWVMTLTIVTSIAILLAGIICFLIAIRLVKIRRLNNLMLHTESNHTIGIQSILLFLVYFFSTLPYYVILFHSYISTGYINARLLQSVAFLSLPLNATISPFIYLFMSMKRSKKLTISRPVSVHPTS